MVTGKEKSYIASNRFMFHAVYFTSSLCKGGILGTGPHGQVQKKSRNFKLGLQRYELLEVMHEWLKNWLLVSRWWDVHNIRDKASSGCKEKKWKLEQKKGSVGIMVHFCVQVQETHHIVKLYCAQIV
jgi:hypothetical protein